MTGELDKSNIKNLDNWNVNDPLAAKHLQQAINVLKALGGISRANQVLKNGRPFEVRQFQVVRVDKDVIICHSLNGDIADEENEIKIALPYILRFTPFNMDQDIPPEARKGRLVYSWTFENDDGTVRYDKRTSIDTEDDDDEEIQVITPSYEPKDTLFAMTGVTGGNGVYHDEEKQIPVVWQDMDQARHWARSSEDEEEEEETS